MTRKERYEKVIDYFKKNNPTADTELHYTTPYELIVAVILSAQCTDVRVNKITPKFFEDFPTVEVLGNSSSEVVFEYIRSCSYPNNKAKHLVGMAKMVLADFGGEIPSTMQDLIKLPGVGRKTANVILSVAFHKPAMAVDTHVFRVSKRIGLTIGAKTPLETEQQLVKHIPKDLLGVAHHWLILHGRYVCVARAPKCENCGIRQFCQFYTKKKK